MENCPWKPVLPGSATEIYLVAGLGRQLSPRSRVDTTPHKLVANFWKPFGFQCMLPFWVCLANLLEKSIL
jgi:hypothetical protein